MTHETQLHLGNKSKVNKTCYSETYCPNLSTDIKKQNSTTLPKCNNTHANIVKEVLASTCPYNNFSRSRSHRKNLTHVKSRDREPSRIPVKKLVHLMSKNRKSRRVIKRFIIWTMVFYWKLKHSQNSYVTTSGTRCTYFLYFTPASDIQSSKISRHFHCCCF